MAQLGQSFNPREHDTSQRDFSELPNGIYRFEIEASDVGKTNNGKGTILKTTAVVIEPEEFKGRKLFNNFNLENANPQAQEIGQKQLSSLCRAIWGADAPDNLEDSEELHFLPFTAKVGLGKEQNGYPARAEIKRYYFPDEGDVPEPAIDTNQPAARPAPANDNRRPAANDNRQAAAKTTAAKPAGARPWGNKK